MWVFCFFFILFFRCWIPFLFHRDLKGGMGLFWTSFQRRCLTFIFLILVSLLIIKFPFDVPVILSFVDSLFPASPEYPCIPKYLLNYIPAFPLILFYHTQFTLHSPNILPSPHMSPLCFLSLLVMFHKTTWSHTTRSISVSLHIWFWTNFCLFHFPKPLYFCHILQCLHSDVWTHVWSWLQLKNLVSIVFQCCFLFITNSTRYIPLFSMVI